MEPRLKTLTLTLGLGAGLLGIAFYGASLAGPLDGQHGEHQEHGEQGSQHSMEESHHAEEENGHEHGNASSHGGIVTMTEEFHFETAFMPDHVRVYLYDGEQELLGVEGVTGNIRLRSEDGIETRIDLAVAEADEGPDHLRADYDFSHVDKASMKARVQLAGLPGEKEKTADFMVTFAAARAFAYTCSMHPEVVQAGPGACPKCGMELELVWGHYGCPGHPEVEAALPIECWKCGSMDLVFIPDEHEEEDEYGHGH